MPSLIEIYVVITALVCWMSLFALRLSELVVAPGLADSFHFIPHSGFTPRAFFDATALGSGN
jgi:hypothetical protein